MVKELKLSELEQLQGGGFECLEAFMASSAIFGASSTYLWAYYDTGNKDFLDTSGILMAAFVASLPVVDEICSRR